MKTVQVFLGALLLTLVALTQPAFSQAVPKKYFSAASTNSTNVYAGKGYFRGGLLVNTNATAYYLKLYDKATAPTCGTDTPFWTIPLPINSAPVNMTFNDLQFANGLGFCITGALADNDTTVAATGIVVDLAVSGR